MDTKLNDCTVLPAIHRTSRSQTDDPVGAGTAEAEIARWSWRIADATDPVSGLEGFLGSNGLPAHDLSSLNHRVHSSNERGQPPVTADRHAVLFLSAAGCAALAGAAGGKPTPAPAIPDIVAVIRAGAVPESSTPAEAASLPTISANRLPSWQLGPWRSSWQPADHAAAIETVRAAIRAGDVYQTNVVSHLAAPFSGDPTPLLTAVCALPGAKYAAALSGPGWALATGTPELLIDVRDGVLTTRPIKGTRPRTAGGHHELLASAKERAEHVMIVDLMRNDLSHIAATGSVDVPVLFKPRPWCDLWQAESVVTGRLTAHTSLGDVLAAVCPGGSVTGAPKRAALELIEAVEPVGRGPAMGALGVLTHDRLTLGLTIRTMAVADGLIHLWAGGGITIDSDPTAEIAEAAAKAAPLLALAAAHT